MAREPHYPADAAVGAPSAAPSDQPAGGEERKGTEAGRNRKIAAGVAVGIGSAAIVAALLYANRGRRGDRGGNG